jgi:hypothetical protein
MKAKSIAEPEEQKRQVMLCRESVGECIDSCRIEVVPGPVQVVRAVLPPVQPVAGVPPVEQPPLISVPPGEMPEKEPSCEERCSRIKKDCDAAGIGEKACGIKIEGCMRACKFEQQPPKDCAAECRRAGDECVASGYDVESCRVKVDNCVNACPPVIVKAAPEGLPIEPKPAQPEADTGFFARILRAIGIG